MTTEIQIALTVLGVVGSTGWFFWQRYQALERRLSGLDQRFTALDLKSVNQSHDLSLLKEGIKGKVEHYEYLIHANTELIGHRTDRFTTALKALETRLEADINEVKGFLDKTTDFRIRSSKRET
jgi:hypothetical protein